MCEKSRPSDQALTTDLKIQWEDHWDMRTQMWRTIQVSAALVVALVGASKLGPHWFTGVVGALLIVTRAVGIAIVHHLRTCQKRKFRLILRIEEELGLFESIYRVDDGKGDEAAEGNNIFPRVSVRPPGSQEGPRRFLSTPNLIVLLHCVIAGGAIIFVLGIMLGGFGGPSATP